MPCAGTPGAGDNECKAACRAAWKAAVEASFNAFDAGTITAAQHMDDLDAANVAYRACRQACDNQQGGGGGEG